jgi:hypothetical protein
MRMFRSEIQTTLKMLGTVTLVGLIGLAVAWGYEQRKQARTWQNIACAYRVKDVLRRTPMLVNTEPGRDACTVLERLGLGFDSDMPKLTVVR